jgi:periplasmic divalent cation tolerance protein
LPSDTGVIVVITTLPDRRAAMDLATSLVGARLAACASILGECASIYRWQGKLEKAFEVPLLLKTSAMQYAALEAAIRARHPYELPEILAFPAAAGLAAYLDWVKAESSGTEQA